MQLTTENQPKQSSGSQSSNIPPLAIQKVPADVVYNFQAEGLDGACEARTATHLPSIHSPKLPQPSKLISSTIVSTSRIPPQIVEHTEGTRPLRQAQATMESSGRVAPEFVGQCTDQQRQTWSGLPLPQLGIEARSQFPDQCNKCRQQWRNYQDVQQWPQERRINTSQQSRKLPISADFKQLHSTTLPPFLGIEYAVSSLQGEAFCNVTQTCEACHKSKRKCFGGRPCELCKYYMQTWCYATETEVDVKSTSDLSQVSRAATIDTCSTEVVPPTQNNQHDLSLYNIPLASQTREQTVANCKNTCTAMTPGFNRSENSMERIFQAAEDDIPSSVRQPLDRQSAPDGFSRLAEGEQDLRGTHSEGQDLGEASNREHSDLAETQPRMDGAMRSGDYAADKIPALAETATDPIDVEKSSVAEPIDVDVEVPPTSPKSNNSQDDDCIVVEAPKRVRDSTRSSNRRGKRRRLKYYHF